MNYDQAEVGLAEDFQYPELFSNVPLINKTFFFEDGGGWNGEIQYTGKLCG